MEEKLAEVRHCQLQDMFDKDFKKLTLAIAGTGVEEELTMALKNLGIVRKAGRAPAGGLEDQLQLWLESMAR
eukprot:6823313-Lingulodinium_polyedra.AAC.1